VFYRRNGLQINGGINYLDSRSKGYTDNHIFYKDYTLKSHNEFPSNYNGYGAFAELSYQLSKNTTIGINVRYYKNPKSQTNRKDRSDYIRNHQIDSTLATTSFQESHFETQNYSFFIDNKLDTLGSKISFESSYIHKSSRQNLDFS